MQSIPEGNYPLTVCNQKWESFGWVVHYTPKGRRYKLWEDLSDMIPVRKEYLESSFYVYPDMDSANAGRKTGGSGFFASCSLDVNTTWFQPYAVTNWHVVEKHKNPVLRINTADGRSDFLETNLHRWRRHPDGDDLAALPVDLPLKEFRYVCVGTGIFMSKEMVNALTISPGDEVYMIGRFVGVDGEQKNTPAVRFGNIAMLPSEPIMNKYGHLQESFLVDCRSVPGYSGSPVFLILFPQMPRPPFFETSVGQVYDSRRHGPFLLGIDWLHLNNYEEVLSSDQRTPISPRQWVKSNTGMAEVIPAWRLLELLDLPEFKMQKKQEDDKITAHKEPEPSYITLDSAEKTGHIQTTKAGAEIAVPTTDQFFGDLEKASRKKT